ncbi:MAG TPA: hypothetical protein PK536_11635 [Ignavibacteria bacterium]|nr:hypothetical protein [Bacteroidota bacterium]HRI86085.1 hypothetical protein [Ignavibacteria bacterium]HRK00650.1 hypothetical protein [Ignavibacteria bacterium]
MRYLLFLFLTLILFSCASSEYDIRKDITGTWIIQHQNAGNSSYERNYYQFIFQKDSFFIEMGLVSDDPGKNAEPFRAKGLYKIYGNVISMKGVAKAEGFTKYNADFEEKFDYIFDKNTMDLFPHGNIFYNGFYLIRRF